MLLLKSLTITILSLFLSIQAFGQDKNLALDVGGSSGNFMRNDFKELTAGLNWNFLSGIAWRNAIHTRMTNGEDKGSGFETALVFQYQSYGAEDPNGWGIFGTFGKRFAQEYTTGKFLEAGLYLKISGIALSGGYKHVAYDNPMSDGRGGRESTYDNYGFIRAVVANF